MMFWCLSCSAMTVNGITRQMVTFHCKSALFLLWLVISDHKSDKEYVGRALNDQRVVRRRRKAEQEAEQQRLNQQRKQQTTVLEKKWGDPKKQ